MKKVAVLILIVAVCESLAAQISVGLLAGNNFSKIKDNTDYKKYTDLISPDVEEYFFTNGLFVGIPVEISFTNKLSLLTTFSFLQKGTKFNKTISFTEDYIQTGDGKATSNYLELPVQTKFYLYRKKFRIYAMAGPEFGYLISIIDDYELSIYNSTTGISTSESIDSKRKFNDLKHSGYNRLDVSFTIGTGCDYKVGIGNISLNFSYVNGLTNLLKQGDGFAEGPKQYNRGFTVSAGYVIPLLIK